MLGILAILLPVCLVERPRVHIPMTVIYSFWMSFAQYTLFYQKFGFEGAGNNRFKYVYENQISAVFILGVFKLFVIYVTVIFAYYVKS